MRTPTPSPFSWKFGFYVALLLVGSATAQVSQASTEPALDTLARGAEVVSEVHPSIDDSGGGPDGGPPTALPTAPLTSGRPGESQTRVLGQAAPWTLSCQAAPDRCVDYGAWSSYAPGSRRKRGGYAYVYEKCTRAPLQLFTRTAANEIRGFTVGSDFDGPQCLAMATRSVMVGDNTPAYPVFHWTCDGSSTQKWRWSSRQPSGVVLRNFFNGQCLTTRGDRKLYVMDCDSALQNGNKFFSWSTGSGYPGPTPRGQISPDPSPTPSPVRTPLPGPQPSPRVTPVPTPTPTLTPAPTGGSCGDAWISQALAAHNALRRAAGAKPLACDPKAMQISHDKAANMCETKNFSHDGFESRCKAAGYGYCGENILYNYDNGADAGSAATLQWKNSPPHYENIVNTVYTVCGLSYFKCGSSGQVYWSAIFGD